MFLGKSQAVLPDTAAQKSTQRPDYPQLDNNFPHVQVSKIDTSRPREEFRRDDYNDDDPHGGGGGMMPGRFVNFYISNDSLGLNTYVATAVVVGSIVLFVTGCVLWQYCKQRLEHSRRSETGNDDDNDIRRGSRHSGSVRRGHTSIEAEELGYACPSPPRSSAGDDGDDVSERSRTRTRSRMTEPAAAERRVLTPCTSSSDNCDRNSSDQSKCEQQCLYYEYEERDVDAAAPTEVDDLMSASINNVNGDDNVSDDCSSSAGNDTLQYDNDSYHDHVLSCDNGCPDPELSTSLTEKDDDDISDYLAGLVLAISPDVEREPEKEGVGEGEREGEKDQKLSSPAESRRSDISLPSDESFSRLQDVKPQPEFSPYHLAWSTPHLVPVPGRAPRRSSSTKSFNMEGAPFSLPPAAPTVPVSHRESGKAPHGKFSEKQNSSSASALYRSSMKATAPVKTATPSSTARSSKKLESEAGVSAKADVHDTNKLAFSCGRRSSSERPLRRITASVRSVDRVLTSQRSTSNTGNSNPDTPCLSKARSLDIFRTPVRAVKDQDSKEAGSIHSLTPKAPCTTFTQVNGDEKTNADSGNADFWVLRPIPRNSGHDAERCSNELSSSAGKTSTDQQQSQRIGDVALQSISSQSSSDVPSVSPSSSCAGHASEDLPAGERAAVKEESNQNASSKDATSTDTAHPDPSYSEPPKQRPPTRRSLSAKLDNVFHTPATSRSTSASAVTSYPRRTQPAFGLKYTPGTKSAGKLVNRPSPSAEAMRKYKTLAALGQVSAHDSLRDLVARCSLGAASFAGSSMSRFSGMNNSLDWDSFPFRGANESMIWDDEQLTEEDEVFSDDPKKKREINTFTF